MPTIDEIKQRVNDAMADAGLAPELEKQFRVLVQAVIARLDLVPREEFDAQARVLEQTRERLEALEQTLNELLNESEND